MASWFPWVWCHLSTTHHCHPLTESCPADPPLLDQTRASASPENGSQLFFNILIFFDFWSSSIYANISSLNICCWYQRIQAPAAASEKWELSWKVSISDVAPSHTTSQIYIFIVKHICCRDLNNAWNWIEAFHFNFWSKGWPTIKHLEIDDLHFLVAPFLISIWTWEETLSTIWMGFLHYSSNQQNSSPKSGGL